MTRVKVCGLTTRGDLETAVEAGVDAVGIICDVSVDTPREVSVDRASELVEATPPFVTSVLVTMPDDLEATIDLLERVDPDAVQLHGGATVEEIATVRTAVGGTVLLAIDAEEIESASAYDTAVDAFVVDTVDEDGGGGTGEVHDWDRTRAAAADLESPIVLAGGLTPENVPDAIRTVEPFAVDVASGVEASGGVKDADAVRSFVARANGTTDPVDLEVNP